jgi:hypothetical protein
MAAIIVPGVTGAGIRRGDVTASTEAWKSLWMLVTNIAGTADSLKPHVAEFSVLLPLLQRVRGQVRSPAFHTMLEKLEDHDREGVPGLTAETLKRDVLSVLEQVVPSRVRYGLV